jgi:ribosome-associated protein
MRRIDFELRGEFITLDALLKATGLADSGGRAKAMVAAGQVTVDGQQELRKACKLRARQCVGLAGARIHLHAPATSDATAPGGSGQGHDSAVPAPEAATGTSRADAIQTTAS